MTPKSDWKWFGSAGHLIVASHCRFHLFTQVGPWLISTIGEYVPDSGVQEVLAKSRGIELQGRGDYREADWMQKNGYEEIGFGRTYETMVFLAGKPCDAPDCNCGQPEIDGCEQEMEPYNDRAAANAGHLAMCEKYASIIPETNGKAHV